MDFDAKLGPLAALAGTWEGIKGDDTAPSEDRGTERNQYRERIALVPISHKNTLTRVATEALR